MREILAQLKGRDAHPAVQFLKYGIAGGLATVVDMSGFYAAAILLLPALTPSDPAARLLGLNPAPLAESVRSAHYVWDKTLSFLAANFVAYVINVMWVFTPGRHSRLKEFALFYLVSGVSFAVGTGLGWVLIRAVALPTTYVYVVNAFVSLMINFVLRKFWVFKG